MRHAFTLIELLVVITIIVVLLALLTPALNMAIYQAQLVQCGANQRMVAATVIQYAFANRRYYPERPNMDGPPEVRAYLSPLMLYTYNPIYDFRPVIKDRLGLSVNKNMQCVLVDPMDLENTLPDETLHGNQALWSGWYYSQYKGADLPGMRKLGDRFEWGRSRFSLLFSDSELNRNAQGCHSSHPDIRTGVMTNVKAKRVGIFTEVTLLQTYSWWVKIGATPARGPVDLNYCYDDTSVRRMNGVEVHDKRMERVPTTQTNDEPGLGYQIPSE